MQDLQYDRLNWMAQHLKIVTMEGELLPLRANIAQLKIHNTLELQRSKQLPMRMIVLKARREGVSTYVEGRFFCEINVKPRRYACICSADLDASNKVFKMSRLFQDKMSVGIKRPTVYSNRKEIVYADPHMSEFIVQTAGKQVLGRGGLVHYLHATEFGFWDNAKDQFGGAAQEVPDDPDTMIVIESTANGTGGAFYDIYMQALDDWRKTKDVRNYLPVFLPWYIFPRYQMKVEGDFQVGRAHAAGYDAEWLEGENELVELHGCVPEQLMWRRWAIKNRCQGDLSLFRQEFPATVDEAFQSTGRPVFSQVMLRRQEAVSAEHPGTGLFKKEHDRIRFATTHRVSNCWKMAYPPVAGHQYAMGIDTAEGRLSDSSDPKSAGDYHAAAIYDRFENRYVCIFRGRDMSQYEFAKQCLAAARYYNDAYVAPEIPNGMELLGLFKREGYLNLYNRQIHDEQIVTDESENLGWRTTSVTRPWLVEGFKTAMLTGDVWLGFVDLINEMRTFIYDKTGKPIHAPGKHDDLLFAAMIAMQVHQRCPLVDVPYGYESTVQAETERASPRESLSRRGVVDYGPWADDEDDLWLFTE